MHDHPEFFLSCFYFKSFLFYFSPFVLRPVCHDTYIGAKLHKYQSVIVTIKEKNTILFEAATLFCILIIIRGGGRGRLRPSVASKLTGL